MKFKLIFILLIGLSVYDAYAQCTPPAVNFVAANSVAGKAGTVGKKYRHNYFTTGVYAETMKSKN